MIRVDREAHGHVVRYARADEAPLRDGALVAVARGREARQIAAPERERGHELHEEPREAHARHRFAMACAASRTRGSGSLVAICDASCFALAASYVASAVSAASRTRAYLSAVAAAVSARVASAPAPDAPSRPIAC